MESGVYYSKQGKVSTWGITYTSGKVELSYIGIGKRNITSRVGKLLELSVS
jgi:hypothetical protein